MFIAINLVSKKYDDQICSAANMESQSTAASNLIGCNELYSNEIEGYIFYVIDMDWSEF